MGCWGELLGVSAEEDWAAGVEVVVAFVYIEINNLKGYQKD